MNHNESIENYLESILILSEKKPVVRSVDIANELGFKKPSISVAVKNMKEKEYIEVSPEGYISLTREGKRIAKSVYDRHKFFRDWLKDIGVDDKTAEEDACSMEHVISEKTFKAIRKYVKGE
ncbi:MAG: metal-dependent transcriptional regulator [Mogibacterium sp.]|nr:metal-dependent transcriptional regulator [Mogibacterium sp.]